MRSARIGMLVCALSAIGTVTSQEPQTLPPAVLSPKSPSAPSLPTAPMPPKGPVIPVAGTGGSVGKAVPDASPAKRRPAPFDRFRKYDELSDLNRDMVFTAQRGWEWLCRDGIHLPHGRFIPGLNPSLGRATSDDHYLRQAIATIALCRSAALTGEERHAVRAAQSILSLLSETTIDPTTPGARTTSAPAASCNRTAAAAFLAAAIFELPDAPMELVQRGHECCQFIRTQLKSDGSVGLGETAADSDEARTYVGAAFYAIALSNRADPQTWKNEALANGLSHYRKKFLSAPHPSFVPWMTAACAECYRSSKQSAVAEFAFEMNDWLQKLPYQKLDPARLTWRGGFPTVTDGRVIQTAPTIESGFYALSLGECCRLIRAMERPDVDRFEQYRHSLSRALQFTATLQFADENTQHFAGHFRPVLAGAFHNSADDGTVRIDRSALAVAAYCRFLTAAAE